MVLLSSLFASASWCNSLIHISKYLAENVSKQSKIVLCGTIGNQRELNPVISCVHAMPCNLLYVWLWLKYELELTLLLYYIFQTYMQYDFLNMRYQTPICSDGFKKKWGFNILSKLIIGHQITGNSEKLQNATSVSPPSHTLKLLWRCCHSFVRPRQDSRL